MSSYMMCAIKDEAVGCYMQPFVCRSQNEAIRSFTDAVNDAKTPFNAHPNDYTLYIVGEWDDHAGLMRELSNNQKLCSGSDVVRSIVELVRPQ